jgi:hypothetical protein
LPDLLGGESEDRQYFDHNLDNYSGHSRSGWDLGINLEAMEETFDTLKEVDKSIIA